MKTRVYCEDCDGVHADTRDQRRPWKYRCTKRPTQPGYLFVHPVYSPEPPFQRCQDVNFDGKCPDFVSLRAGPVEVLA